MPSLKPSLPAMLLVALTLTALPGCSSTPKDEKPLTGRKHKLTPLPAAILQIELQPSTASLSKASQWSEASEQILKSETPK